MSLVGPRPVIPYEVEFYPEWYFGRFAVKPGLTGPVAGERPQRAHLRRDGSLRRRLRRAEVLRLDLRILARTALVVARRQGVA